MRAFRHERQSAWFGGIEGAFRHFGGLPAELLPDNAGALVDRHDAATREVTFNERFHAFTRYRGVRPVACAPHRARTKGKDERGVGYVKGDAIACRPSATSLRGIACGDGRDFASWAALEAHLARWTREVADVRVHGATGEAPLARFEGEEAGALRPSGGKPPFRQVREPTRRVQNDGCSGETLVSPVGVDTDHYSVPWALIGASVGVVVDGGEVRIDHAGAEVARHGQRRGRRERAVDRAHLRGIVAVTDAPRAGASAPAVSPGADLLRPLAGYERVAGGGW